MKELFIGLIFCMICARCAEIRKFEINASEDDLQDLKNRLSRARFPIDSPAQGWEYGTNITYMKELISYWKSPFLDQWKAIHESKLNSFPQFVTEIEGLDIHFVHVKSKVEGAIPLLFAHGWPGSFFECTKIIPLLTDPESYGGSKEDAFHVVCPSLPGFGFSSAPKVKGYGPDSISKLFVQLMAILGYDKYVAQGGDWGSRISTRIAVNDPEHCVGIHLNLFMVISRPWTGFKIIAKAILPSALIDNSKERAFLESLKKYFTTESGYMLIQGTKPDTVGFGLSDSPIGMAAYIIEKFYTWSDCNGTIENRFTKDELLTNVMIYWLGNSITSSMRIYYELLQGSDFHISSQYYVSQPTALAVFKDIVSPPIHQLRDYVNAVQVNEMPSGGHFAALEEPQLLVEDIRSFVRKIPALSKPKKDEL